MAEKEKPEHNEIVGRRIELYGSKKGSEGKVIDRVTVGLASGTNEYIPVTQYVVEFEFGNIDNVYPYQVQKIIDAPVR